MKKIILFILILLVLTSCYYPMHDGKGKEVRLKDENGLLITGSFELEEK